MAKMTLEKLAMMINEGFEAVEIRLANLEFGQEDIILKLDNYAYKFEVEDLKKRVSKIEKRV